MNTIIEISINGVSQGEITLVGLQGMIDLSGNNITVNDGDYIELQLKSNNNIDAPQESIWKIYVES